jgi:hypothetical protein
MESSFYKQEGCHRSAEGLALAALIHKAALDEACECAPAFCSFLAIAVSEARTFAREAEVVAT